MQDKNIKNIQENNVQPKVTQNGVIVHSDLLLDYLKKNYPSLYFVSSTTKVLTDFQEFLKEVKREDFQYVVPDFRLNKSFDKLNTLTQIEKDKVEFLCNECCWFGCKDRKRCYETVSRKNLGENCPEHHCAAPNAEEGYRFSKAMKNPEFIGIEDIQNNYLPMGFSNFKIEGRGLGSALVLEFLEEGSSMLFYVIQTCLYFSVYLAILQLGVRTFVTELTASFQGIADKLLPGSVPGVDCAVVYGFGSANAVPLGFLAGFTFRDFAIRRFIVQC